MEVAKWTGNLKGFFLPVLFLAVAVLTGCATGPTVSPGANPRDRQLDVNPLETAAKAVSADSIVAIDLVSVLMQLPDYAPFYTTVQFSEPRTAFGRALLKSMTQSGFGIQMVPQDQGVHYVSYATRVVTTEQGENMEYSLKIKDLEIQREYKVDSASASTAIYPLSEVVIIGVKPSKVIANDDIYKQYALNQTFPSGVTFLDNSGKVAEQHKSLTKVSSNPGAVTGESFTNEKYLVLARASIFTIDRLSGKGSTGYNPADFLARKQLTVRFRSNTLSLGNANKLGIRKILDSFRPEEDLYTITGCSHGRSLMFDGTEGMALSRSQRVKEELLSYGIKQDNLREEGCFQTEYGDALPPNGVIITHKRRVVARL